MGLSNERKVMLPNLRIPLTDIPEAKDWKVGDKYFLEFDSKLTGVHQSKDGKGYAEFEIVAMEEPETEEEESEEEDEEDEGEDESTESESKGSKKSPAYKRK